MLWSVRLRANLGDDQKEIYREDNMPCVLVYSGETIPDVPNRSVRTPAQYGKATGVGTARFRRFYACMRKGSRHDPIDVGLSNHLIGAMIECEFGVASADALPHTTGEGHAFGFVHQRYEGRSGPGRAGFPQHLFPVQPARLTN